MRFVARRDFLRVRQGGGCRDPGPHPDEHHVRLRTAHRVRDRLEELGRRDGPGPGRGMEGTVHADGREGGLAHDVQGPVPALRAHLDRYLRPACAGRQAWPGR